MKKNNETRRGITLAETVISIAVIALVTAALLTVVSSQAGIRKSTLEALNATGIAENVIECYVFASDDDKFCSALEAVLGVEEINPNGKTAVGKYDLIIEKDTYAIKVTVKCGDEAIVENLSYPEKQK